MHCCFSILIMTSASTHSFAAYADAMTSPQIQCKTAAYQTLEPIRITGGVSVEPNPDTDFKCTNSGEAQPTQLFILNITRIADMAFIKMQGKDGILEPISYVPNGTGAYHCSFTSIEPELCHSYP